MTQERSRFDVIGQMGSLRRYARSLTRDASEAEDLVQDALLRAYEKRESFNGQRNLRRWLFSILHNRFVDVKRQAQSNASKLDGVADAAATAATIQVGATQEHSARLNKVAEYFMALPDDQRAALHLVAIEGFSYSEAAAALDIPVGTLMSRISRARAALRDMEDGKTAETGDSESPLQMREGAKILQISRRRE